MAIHVQKLAQTLVRAFPEATWTSDGLQWDGVRVSPSQLRLFWDDTGSVEGVAAAIRQGQEPLTNAERARLWPHLLAAEAPLEADALGRPVALPGLPVFAQIVLTADSARHWTVLPARRVPAGVDPADLWREAEARVAAAIPLPTTATTLPTGAVIVSWDDPAAADYAWAFARRVDEAVVGIPASGFGAVVLDPTPIDVGIAFRWVPDLYRRYQAETPSAHPVTPMPLYLVHGALPSNPWAALTPTP